LRTRPGFSTPPTRRLGFLTTALTPVLAGAVLCGIAAGPGLTDRLDLAASSASDRRDDWYEDTADEQLRQDQCLMAEVLRLGGPTMAGIAQDGLNQTPDKLHTLANQEHWTDTPLAQAYKTDREAFSKELDALNARQEAWKKPVSGLPYPGGFKSVTDFEWPPGTSASTGKSFHAQTGLSGWIAEDAFDRDGHDGRFVDLAFGEVRRTKDDAVVF